MVFISKPVNRHVSEFLKEMLYTKIAQGAAKLSTKEFSGTIRYSKITRIMKNDPQNCSGYGDSSELTKFIHKKMGWIIK